MSDDPKKSVNYSNDSKIKGNNNDITQIEEPNKFPERAFNYLEIDNSAEKFNFEGEEKTDLFKTDKGKYDYIICVLLKNDLSQSSKLLDKTLDGIYQNLNNLQDLGISSSNTLVCIFIKNIIRFSLFPKDEIQNIKPSQSFYLYSKAKKNKYPSSTIYLVTKTRGLTDFEALKCFYLGILEQIKMEKNPIFSSVITAGVEPKTLKKLILSSYNNSKIHGASVGVIESEGFGLFSMIEQYERVHFNTYNMNFYGISAAIPVSSLLSTLFIDDKILGILKEFYAFRNNNLNQSISYHDYSLGLYLYKNNINVQFLSNESTGTLHTYELEYADYQEIWVNRYSGYYANFFNLINELINFAHGAFFKKFILLFQIIGFLIEFIYPSLSSMVIYSIFYEAFDIYDYRLATFFTMLYIFMLLAAGMCSLITKNPKEMRMTNLFLYIFMEVYYLLVIICSIIAMDNVKKNKSKNEYKFNNAAISCIIIFTFIPYIIPMLLRINAIFSNIFNMLIYIGLGAPISTSNFLMGQLWNASDTAGGNEVDERKSFVLIIFFLFNLFFGSLTFYNYNRRTRVKCVMGFGIFYLLYNFFKVIGIVSNILGKSNEAIDPNKNSQIIEGIKNAIGKYEDNDMRSEQKMLKNSSNNYNNNIYDKTNDNESNNNGDNNQYNNNYDEN